MPSTKTVRPYQFTILPILPDPEARYKEVQTKLEQVQSQVKLLEQARDRGAESYRTELTRLGKRLTEQTEQAEQYKKGLASREAEVASLKARMPSTPTVSYHSPLEALLGGYLREGLDVLIEASIDYTSLDTQAATFFVARDHQPESASFADYVRNRTGRGFGSSQDLDRWISQIESTPSWESSTEGKQLLLNKDQRARDLAAIESVRSMGVSLEIITAMQGALDAKPYADVDDRVEASKTEFARQRQTYLEVIALKESYDKLDGIQKKVAERRARPTFLPVLVYVPTPSTSLKVYAPRLDEDNPFSAELKKILIDEVGSSNEGPMIMEVGPLSFLDEGHYSSDILEFTIRLEDPFFSGPGQTLTVQERSTQYISRLLAAIPRAPLHTLFGIAPKVFYLSEMGAVVTSPKVDL